MDIFPQQDDLDSLPTDGSVFRLPKYCHKVFGEKCQKYYRQIKSEDGFHVCPYGYNSYSRAGKILTGLFIKDKKSNKIRSRHFHESDFVASLSSKELLRQIEANIFEGQKAEYLDAIDTSKNSVAGFNLPIEVLDNTIHELRKLNRNLKTESNNLNYECQKDNPDLETIRDRSRNIYSTSTLFSIRLDTYDFLTNPELATGFTKNEIPIYKKFEKSRHILKYQAYKKGISIKLEGTSVNKLLGYDIFEILPFILFENAIKYSFNGTEVICKFEENYGKTTKIVVQNKGVVPEKSERDFLKKRGHRSSNVIDNDYDGSGIGLFLADEICKLHNVELDINYSETTDKDKSGNFYVNIYVNLEVDDNI